MRVAPSATKKCILSTWFSRKTCTSVGDHNFRVFVLCHLKNEAWFDRNVAAEWIRKVWVPYRMGDSRHAVILTDSVDASSTEQWRQALESTGTLAWRGPIASTTHLWQAVDRGVGSHIKTLMRQAQDEFMLSSKNHKKKSRRLHGSAEFFW